VETEIDAARDAVVEAAKAITAAQNNLQLVGPLRGPAGARLSPQEKHSGLEMGHEHLKEAINSLEEAMEKLHVAVGLMTGR
jgi:hypothetical protein